MKPCANPECDNPVPPGKQYDKRLYCCQKCRSRMSYLKRRKKTGKTPKPRTVIGQKKISDARWYASKKCVKYTQCLSNPKKRDDNAMCLECNEMVIKNDAWLNEPGRIVHAGGSHSVRLPNSNRPMT